MGIKEYYQTNKSFKVYVDKFAKDRGVTPEVALTHQIIKDAWEWDKKESKSTWKGIES